MLNFIETINNQHYILFLVAIISYFFGSIPSGFIIGKIFNNSDIRNSGSGNIGATNMLRVLGKKLGFYTLVADMSKGFLSCYIANYLGGSDAIMIAADCAVIGHIFPIWLRFKGGKGVATSFAVFCYCDVNIGLVCIAVWLCVFLYTRISSLASIITFSLAPIIGFLFNPNKLLFIMILVVCTLIVIRHYDNIIRLIKKDEKSF